MSLLDELKQDLITKQKISNKEHVVLVLDTSRSMGWSCQDGTMKIDALKKAVKQFIMATSPSFCELAILAFCNEVRWVPVGEAMAGNMWAGGSTDMAFALETAYERLSASDFSVKRIVLMSDGCPDNKKRVSEVITEVLVPCGIVIDTIAFGDDADREFLHWIAEATGGKFQEAKDAGQLVKSFELLETRVRGLLKGV